MTGGNRRQLPNTIASVSTSKRLFASSQTLYQVVREPGSKETDSNWPKVDFQATRYAYTKHNPCAWQKTLRQRCNETPAEAKLKSDIKYSREIRWGSSRGTSLWDDQYLFLSRVSTFLSRIKEYRRWRLPLDVKHNSNLATGFRATATGESQTSPTSVSTPISRAWAQKLNLLVTGSVSFVAYAHRSRLTKKKDLRHASELDTSATPWTPKFRLHTRLMRGSSRPASSTSTIQALLESTPLLANQDNCLNTRSKLGCHFTLRVW